MYIYTIKQQQILKAMTIFATLSNGNQEQVLIEGNTAKIFNFIENYEGNDLGNDLMMQDFVTNAEPTGVIIEKA